MRGCRRCGDRERGAVLVEFAFVGIILVVLLAGAYDYGMGWRVGLAANEGVRAGARVGSGQGNALSADYSLLSSMRAALESSGTLDQVERVIVFETASTAGTVPSACINGNGSGEECNILTGAQFRGFPDDVDDATDADGCISPAEAKSWCPDERVEVQLTADYLGVWVRIRHDHMFPLLGDSTLVDRKAVMRIEPEETNP